MNSLLHREGDDDLDDLNGTKDREITLGTTMILAIFFALAVLCAIFFGLGYQLGHKSVPVVAAVAPTESQPGTNFAGFKPAAGSPAGSAPDRGPGQTVAVPLAAAAPAPRPAPARAAVDPDSEVVGDPPTPAPAAVAPAPRPVPTAAASAPVAASTATPVGAGAIVQIAAVSHQEDADLLVTTLKRRGYNVAIHTEPQDKLLHVQVGPFASHKEADAMRQKLLADGFNAIVKDSK